jgi:SulP family sulfate permease
MIITQSAATARVYAARHEQQLDENADLAGLFAANAAAGLSGTFVVNGSPTQTAMVEGAGAQSQVALVATRPFNPPPQFFNPRHVPFWA